MMGLVFALILLNNLNQALVLEKQFKLTEVTAVELDDASDDSQEDVAVYSFEYMLEQNNNISFIQIHKKTALHSTQHHYSSRAPPYSKA